MNIVIPMAGYGHRFKQAGYLEPKPLIPIHGRHMIQVVVDNIGTTGHYIFIVLREHFDGFGLEHKLPEMVRPSRCSIIPVDSVTQGAACTVLLTKALIDNDEEMLIANSDQWAKWSPRDFLSTMRGKEADGGILTFMSNHPKWSYAKIDGDRVIEVAEKKPISHHATVGIYWFKQGKDFVLAAERMINKDIRTNGEFYVCPVFNEMIEDGKKVLIYEVDEMKGLGTPDDFEAFKSDRKTFDDIYSP